MRYIDIVDGIDGVYNHHLWALGNMHLKYGSVQNSGYITPNSLCVQKRMSNYEMLWQIFDQPMIACSPPKIFNWDPKLNHMGIIGLLGVAGIIIHDYGEFPDSHSLRPQHQKTQSPKFSMVHEVLVFISGEHPFFRFILGPCTIDGQQQGQLQQAQADSMLSTPWVHGKPRSWGTSSIDMEVS